MHILLFFILSIALNALSAQDSSQSTSQVIYLVRHAEKAIAESHDPPLSEKGIIRAKRLSALLSEAQISAIYSTNFIRTLSTAEPLSTKLGLPIELYDPLKRDIIQTIKNSGDNLLIIGHSNTIPNLINTLLAYRKFEHLAEDEYDKLFILSKLDEVFNVKILEY